MEFEAELQQLIARNWPQHRLEARFSETYAKAVYTAECRQEAGINNLWRAIWRYETITQGPEPAYARVAAAVDRINPRELFLIRQEYFNQTQQPDQLRAMCEDAIAAGQTLPMAYQALILLECRSGQLGAAQALVQQVIKDGVRGVLKQSISFAHMLGMWPLFKNLVARYAEVVPQDNLDLIRWRTIKGWVAEDNNRAFPYPHRFINLERATGRRAALVERYARYADQLQFFTAIDGVEMTKDIYVEWCPGEFLHYGGVANLRSQHAVWMEFLAGTDEHILIFEDDAWPYADMATWADLTALVAAEDPEITFFNERGAGCWWERDSHASDTPWVPYAAAISSYTDTMRAPGLDGYLLSRAGAEKLVANFAKDKVVYNIDWQIAAYSLTPEAVATMPGNIHRDVLERVYSRLHSTTRLRSFALERPIVCQFAAGHATVHDTNRQVYLKNLS